MKQRPSTQCNLDKKFASQLLNSSFQMALLRGVEAQSLISIGEMNKEICPVVAIVIGS